MMDIMRHRVLALVLGILAVGSIAAPARADDEAPKVYDGRLEAIQNPGGNGGPRNVTLQSGGTSLTYFLLVGCSVICIGVMFKNAKRTHLD
jgi:hypothetical protein